MTMPYPTSPNDPGQPQLPTVHEPIPQRIHEPIPAEPIHPDEPAEPGQPSLPGEPPHPPASRGKTYELRGALEVREAFVRPEPRERDASPHASRAIVNFLRRFGSPILRASASFPA